MTSQMNVVCFIGSRWKMFDSELSRDGESRKVTRRVFLAGGTTAVAGLALFSLRNMGSTPVVEASGSGGNAPGMVTVVNFSDDGKNLGKETIPKVIRTDAEWKAQLSRNAYD